MKKLNFTKIFIIAFYLLFFLLLLKNSQGYLDPDLGWHLKAGEEVVKTREVNKINHYNYVFGNQSTWVNHEWLSDSIMFLIYNNFGYFVLNIVFALIVLSTIIIAHKFIIKNFTTNKKSFFIILPITLLGLISCQPHFGVRVQELSILFLLLELICIYNFEKSSVKKEKNSWKKLIPILIIIIFWTNMHGSFLLGIFILFFYLFIKIFETLFFYLKNKNQKINKIGSFFNFENLIEKKYLKIFFVFSLISTFLTIINPYGLKLFDFLFSYKNNAYLTIISEWLPQYYYPFLYWQILYIAIILAIIIISFLLYKNKPKINSVWNLSLIFLFTILAIKSRRHFPLLFISSLPFISFFLHEELKTFLENIKFKKTKLDVFIKTYILLIFLFVFALFTINIKIIKNPFDYFCNDYPCKALRFIKNDISLTDARIFNSYGWGGYLIHEWPEKQIFIDGRLPQKKINNHSYLEEYLMFTKKEEIAKKIEEYKIELFILEKTKNRKLNWLDKKIIGIKEKTNQKGFLLEFLDKNYNKIYEDEISLIYLKK